jgi:hypothetical protein
MEAIRSSETSVTIFLRSVRRLLVTANVVSTHRFCHSDDGDATFFQNVGSYKSHTANIPEDGIVQSPPCRPQILRYYNGSLRHRAWRCGLVWSGRSVQ